MAAKSASLSQIFTEREIAAMDPAIVQRIEVGINYAITKAGGKVADPVLVKAQFDALKKELAEKGLPPLPGGVVKPGRTVKPQ